MRTQRQPYDEPGGHKKKTARPKAPARVSFSIGQSKLLLDRCFC